MATAQLVGYLIDKSMNGITPEQRTTRGRNQEIKLRLSGLIHSDPIDKSPSFPSSSSFFITSVDIQETTET